MRRTRPIALLAAVLLTPAIGRAQESYKAAVLSEAPPAALSGPVRETLNAQGIRVLDDQGKPYADVWLRKSIPATDKPSGPKGPILFPFLQEGELLGAIRFLGEGHDFRDQPIVKGVYTLRYGLQPQNGDHLGASPFRDFALLVPAAKDVALAQLPQKKLFEQSAESAGTSHPAVLMLLPVAGQGAKGEPAMIRDDEKNTWGVLIPLSLAPKGSPAPVAFPLQLVVVGMATV